MIHAYRQMGLAFRDLWCCRGRVLLVLAQVCACVLGGWMALGLTLDASAMVGAGRRLVAGGVTAFNLGYAPGVGPPARPTGVLGDDLARLLDGTHPSCTTVLFNYPSDPLLRRHVVVLLGRCTSVIGLDFDGGQTGVWLGSQVGEFGLGQIVDLGPHTAMVRGRLPVGAAILDPSAGVVHLDRAVVLSTTYGEFFDSARTEIVGITADEIVGRMLLTRATPDQVDRYVDLVADTGRVWVLPRDLAEADQWYQGDLAAARTGLVATAGLAATAGIGLAVTLRALVRRTARHHGIQRLYGARLAGSRLRLGVFVAVAFTLPASVVACGAAALPEGPFARLSPFLPWVLVAIVAVHVACVEASVAMLRRRPLAAVVKEAA